MKCPNCDIELGAVAKVADESRLSIVITPATGELFDLRTIGGLLADFSKLLEAAGKQFGAKTIVLLEGVDKTGDGGLQFNVIVCRTGDRKVRQETATGGENG